MIKFRIHMIVLCNFLLWHNSVISSVLVGSLIKTTHGFVSVENLCVGDELIILSDNQNITTCRVKEITVTTTNTIIEIVTDPVTIRAISDQLFYDPMMQTWIAAKDITKDSYLLNARLEHIKCVDVKTVSIESTVVYQVSTTMPHTFFVTEQEILTHNFFPVILGVSWLFGLGSVEFAGFNIAAIIGGAAIGIKLFKSKKHKHHKSKIVVKPHIQGSIAGNGGNPDPNDDDEEKDQQKKNRKFNNISKSEFFKKVKDQYEYWKDGLYRRKHGAKGIEDAEFLKWDHLHGDVEAYSKGEIPLGSIDPRTLKIYKAVSKYRRML